MINIVSVFVIYFWGLSVAYHVKLHKVWAGKDIDLISSDRKYLKFTTEAAH